MAFYVIDGLNICREERPTRLTGLISLLLKIKSRGDDFYCVFDQSAYRLFAKGRPAGDVEANVYKEMTNLRSSYSRYFSQIRGKADGKILDLADSNSDYVVLSNDNYSEYQNQYPWLQDKKRFVNEISIFRGRIMCEPLDIAISERTNLEDQWQALKNELDLNTTPKSKVVRAESPKMGNGPRVTIEKNTVGDNTDTVPAVEGRGRRKKCPECGLLLDPPLRFCPKHGKPLVRANTADLTEDTYITSKSDTEEKPMETDNHVDADSPIMELLNSGLITEEIAEVLQYGMDEEPTRLLTDHTEMIALVTVIDKSGSMKKHKQAVIDGQHDMLNALMGSSPSLYDIRLAQILFNDKVEYFQRFGQFRDEHDPYKAHRDVKVLDETNFQPEGFTALYDAILQGICALTPLIHWSRREGVALESRIGILTDGYEEGELGPASRIPPQALRKVIDFMVPRLVNRIILVGIGEFDYAAIGRELGISEVISSDADPQSIRKAFELFSSR